jgi:hypothetical protein
VAAVAGTPVRSKLTRELAWLIALLLVGIVLLPVAIWVVGGTVFGAYEGGAFMDFFAALAGRLTAGDGAAWFLVLSPYLAIGAMRLTAYGWRLAASGRN